MRIRRAIWIFAVALMRAISAHSQSPNATINGMILDPDAKTIPTAQIIAVNDLTGVKYETTTNKEGIYALPNLPPGPYRLQVSKEGFKTLIKPDIILNVQDAISISFTRCFRSPPPLPIRFLPQAFDLPLPSYLDKI